MSEIRSHISRIAWPDRRIPMRAVFGAKDLAARYGYPLLTQRTQSVGIVSLGGGVASADLTAYCTHYGIPVPPLKITSIDGASNDYSGDPQSADMEGSLDVQTIAGATLGMASITVYNAPNSGAGFAHAISQAAKDGHAALSISWGQAEAGWSAGDRTAMDAALQACLAAGVAAFAASGDNGSTDGSPGSNVDYPASSPWCVGVGGTSIGAGGESAWDGSGGGFSKVYTRPSWQAIQGSARGVPDVAADADPNSGYQVVMGGKWYTIGGTSGAAPMWAAAAAVIASITGQRISGPALLARLYAGKLLTDITAGSNGGFQATSGWDACTGLGCLNAAAFAALTSTAPPVPPPVPVPPPPPPPPAPRRLFSLTFPRPVPKGHWIEFQAPVLVPAGKYDVVQVAEQAPATAQVIVEL